MQAHRVRVDPQGQPRLILGDAPGRRSTDVKLSLSSVASGWRRLSSSTLKNVSHHQASRWGVGTGSGITQSGVPVRAE